MRLTSDLINAAKRRKERCSIIKSSDCFIVLRNRMGRFSSEVIEPSGGLECKDVILLTSYYFKASLYDELEVGQLCHR